MWVTQSLGMRGFTRETPWEISAYALAINIRELRKFHSYVGVNKQLKHAAD